MFPSKLKYRQERRHAISIQITSVSCQLSNMQSSSAYVLRYGPYQKWEYLRVVLTVLLASTKHDMTKQYKFSFLKS